MSTDNHISSDVKPTPDEIRVMVEKEIPITREHCYRERTKRKMLRMIAINELMKKYGYVTK